MTEREDEAARDGTLTTEAVDGIQCSFKLGGAVWKICLEKDKNAEKKNEN